MKILILNGSPRPAGERLAAFIDRMVLSRCIFNKDPAAFAYVIAYWKKKGYL